MLCEAMLMCSGRIGRPGSIAAGTTASDYHASEQQHQISVHASLLHTEWQGKKFNIIDTPGYADFISEGIGALRVGDFALVVINARTASASAPTPFGTTPRTTACRRSSRSMRSTSPTQISTPCLP
jgi:translation elongation factor EF-G